MNHYQKLINYNIWATSRLVEQVKTLSPESFLTELGGSFPFIQQTMVHLMQADWIWLTRWQGIP